MDQMYHEVTVSRDDFESNPGRYYTTEDKKSYSVAVEYDPSKTYYEKATSITSLEDYFCNLRYLYDIDDKYIMLPLDEDPFDINANTRAITVPTSFRSSGLGVVGDEIAEMIFLRIDRYFDAMDFDTCKVYVQWENALGEQFITPITMKDLESQPGKIIYAWPISSKVTKQSGPIRFSVRFMKFGEDEETIVYSFSTLTASTTINNGLNYKIGGSTGVNEDEPNILFDSAITNSENTAGPSAAAPEFLANLDSTIYLEPASDGYSLKIKACAGVGDAGQITYKWYHKITMDSARDYLGVEDVGKEEISEHLKPTSEMVKVTAEDAFSELVDYYTMEMSDEGESLNTYKLWIGDKDTFADAVEDPGLYQRYTVLTIKGNKTEDEGGYYQLTGYYYVEAVNRSGNRENTTRSAIAFMPSPTFLNVDITTGDKVMAEGVEEETVDHVEQFLQDDTTADITVSAKSDDKSKLSYSWSKTLKYNPDGETEWQAVAGANGATARVTEPAYYKASVTSMLNLDTMHEDSVVVKMMKKPTKPTFKSPSNPEGTIVSSSAGKVTVELNEAEEYKNPLVSDYVEYHWYVNDDNNPGTGTSGAEMEWETTLIPEFNIPADYTGSIVCKATNHLGKLSADSDFSYNFAII